MKWFKHDSDANTDAKMKKLRHKYGIVGYGLYWYCVELIAGSISTGNITFELEEDAEIVALEWALDQLKVQEMMQYMVSIGLFDIADNNRIRCLKLAKRLDDTNAKNPEIKMIVKQLNSPENTQLLRQTPTNSDQSRLDKIRIDNKSIVGQAQRCLNLLNELAGTKFKHVDSNIDLLKARFKEGYTEQEVIEVIKSKCNEWVNTDGSQYLRPATLFGKTKFSQYHGQSHIAAKPQQQDLTALSNDELFKMATELKIRTQGLFRNDLITAIKGKK